MTNYNFQHTIEQKYLFKEGQKDVILDWLDCCCIRDPKFYFGTIHSIYYDTPTFDSYYEKRNSDYIKTKVRLRWYKKLQKSDIDLKVKCYLEIKRKCGTIRKKERKELLIPSKFLLNKPFLNNKISRISSTVYELNHFPSQVLVPTLLIQYRRYRYIEPKSGSRIALDSNISCDQSNPQYISGLPPVHLDIGILEIKGQHNHLLGSLNPIGNYLFKDAFSKYARCFEQLIQPLERRI
jgi:hypothetical protein